MQSREGNEHNFTFETPRACLRDENTLWRLCLLSDGVVSGEFDSLVSNHAGSTEVLNAVHTKPNRLAFVIAGRAPLQVYDTQWRLVIRGNKI